MRGFGVFFRLNIWIIGCLQKKKSKQWPGPLTGKSNLPSCILKINSKILSKDSDLSMANTNLYIKMCWQLYTIRMGSQKMCCSCVGHFNQHMPNTRQGNLTYQGWTLQHTGHSYNHKELTISFLCIHTCTHTC